MDNIGIHAPVAVILDGRGRKRQRHAQLDKRSRMKRERHSAGLPPKEPICGHNGKTFQCGTLSKVDIKHFHGSLYSTNNKIIQDAFILKYTASDVPKRSRSAKGGSRKAVSIHYYIKKKIGGVVQVCQKAFIGVLQISKDRVQRVSRKHLTTGRPPTETRGGDRATIKNAPKKAAVMQFIERLVTVESHYCRGQTASRQYLPTGLNISKLWRAYNSEAQFVLKVKISFFRKVFNVNYNIGFASPVTDACSTCISLGERIKQEKDDGKKSRLMMEKRLHKLRAKSFFEALKEEREGELTLSFDCQKNMVMPRVPDQAAYYSRQLYTFNFTVVQGTSKCRMTTDNIFCYVWTELDRPKGSNEIASAVYHRLKATDMTNITTVRLFADGCGGQNKNTIMVGMCAKWLATDAPQNVKTLILIFPVPGHSFLPADRVFGRIEKIVRSKPNIIKPEEYVQIFQEHGTVIKLGTECLVHDWKSAVATVHKPPGSWHFQFKCVKRIFLKRLPTGTISVRGEPHYRNDIGEGKSVCKRGKKTRLISPNELASGVKVKDAKLTDVNNLLNKHFGPEWRLIDDLVFYKNALKDLNNNDNIENDHNDDNDENDEGNLCDSEHEDINMHI